MVDFALSEKEMSTVFNTIFRKYDSNGDGKITKEEFQKICYALGHFLETDELEIAFALVDSDGSGEIEREEFLEFWRQDNRFDRLQLDDEQHAKLAQSTLNLST